MNDDLISKQAVLDTIHRFFTEEVDKIPTKKTEDGEVIIICKAQPLFAMNKTLCKRIKELPSVTPTETHMIDKSNFSQEQYKMDLQSAYDCGVASVTSAERTGHWIMDSDEEHGHCDQCGYKTDLVNGDYHNFCRKCGARMVGDDNG